MTDLYDIDYEYVEVTSLGGPVEYLRAGPGELSRELLVAREKYVAGQISSDAFERTVERLLEERSK